MHLVNGRCSSWLSAKQCGFSIKKGIQERVRIFLVAYVTHPMLVYFFCILIFLRMGWYVREQKGLLSLRMSSCEIVSWTRGHPVLLWEFDHE